MLAVALLILAAACLGKGAACWAARLNGEPSPEAMPIVTTLMATPLFEWVDGQRSRAAQAAPVDTLPSPHEIGYDNRDGHERERAQMKQAVIPYPEGLAQVLDLSDREFAEELRFLASAKLFELGKLTAGQAAELAGMGRMPFLSALARIGVPAINLRDEEVDAELSAARELAG